MLLESELLLNRLLSFEVTDESRSAVGSGECRVCTFSLCSCCCKCACLQCCNSSLKKELVRMHR